MQLVPNLLFLLCLFNVFSSRFSTALPCRKEMMRRKRSCSTHQSSIVNVHAVVLGLDGVGKSGKFVRRNCHELSIITVNHLGTRT